MGSRGAQRALRCHERSAVARACGDDQRPCCVSVGQSTRGPILHRSPVDRRRGFCQAYADSHSTRRRAVALVA